MTTTPDTTPGPARPRLTALGQAELLQQAMFNLRTVAGSIETERAQVNECLADPGDAWRHRAVHVARELAYQADRIRAQANTIEQVALDIDRGRARSAAGTGSLNESRPDDVPVEADPPPCGPGDRRPVLYEALTAVVADIGPIGDESSRRAAALMLFHHLRQAGGLDELERQQALHEGWCQGFGDGRTTTAQAGAGGGEDGRG